MHRERVNYLYWGGEMSLDWHFPLSSQCFMYYHDKFDRVLREHDCIINIVDLRLIELIKSLICRDLNSILFSLSISYIHVIIEFTHKSPTQVDKTNGVDPEVRTFSFSFYRELSRRFRCNQRGRDAVDRKFHASRQPVASVCCINSSDLRCRKLYD